MMSLTLVVPGSSTKSMSRFVTMPTSFDPTLPSSVMGIPLKPRCSLTACTADTVASGERHTGSVMNPLRYFLTLRTSETWSSTDML